MSGPPKFRDRDPMASVTGAIDAIVLLHVVVWGLGALWVLTRLYSSLVRRGSLPAVAPSQMIGVLLIAGLSLSAYHSPGVLLTVFTLTQFAVMLGFTWLFLNRYGPTSYLRHLFAGVCLLAAMMIGSLMLDPSVVIADAMRRFVGYHISSTGTGALAGVGLIFCLSNVPRLSPVRFWGLVGLFTLLLALSRMRTAYVGIVIYLLIASVHGKGLRVRQFVGVLIALFLGLLAMEVASRTTDFIVRETKTIETLSDRVPLWGYLTEAVMRDEPLIGFGYFAATRVLAPNYNLDLGTAHSVFFEVLVGGGIVSAVLYLILCASLISYAVRLLRVGSGQAEVVAVVGLFVFSLVVGITSTEGLHAGVVGFAFWSMPSLLPRMCRQAEARAFVATRRRPARAMAPTHAVARQSRFAS
jgi:O-antigen ligase